MGVQVPCFTPNQYPHVYVRFVDLPQKGDSEATIQLIDTPGHDEARYSNLWAHLENVFGISHVVMGVLSYQIYRNKLSFDFKNVINIHFIQSELNVTTKKNHVTKSEQKWN